MAVPKKINHKKKATAKGSPRQAMPVRQRAPVKPAKLQSRYLKASDENPEGYGRLMADIVSNPMAKISELMKRHGFSRFVITSCKRSLQRQDLAVKEELRKVTNKGLLDLVDDRLHRTISAIDDFSIEDASLRDKAYAGDRLFNMRQLIKGEPTQIVSSADRAKLNELLPMLMREAQRRGIIIEGQVMPVAEEQRGLPDSRITVDESE